MLKVFYLDCGGKTNFTANLIVKIMKHNYDIVILADAFNIISVVERKLPEYQYVNSMYQLGISVMSKVPFKVEDICYKASNAMLEKKYTMEKYHERLLKITCDNMCMLAVSAPHHKPYKQIYMVKMIEEVRLYKPTLIIGNFNTGYLEDCPDATEFKFTTGYIGFTALENLGYNDPLKDQGLVSYEDEKGNRERTDHVFTLKPIEEAKYIDMIKYGFDHKGIQVKL